MIMVVVVIMIMMMMIVFVIVFVARLVSMLVTGSVVVTALLAVVPGRMRMGRIAHGVGLDGIISGPGPPGPGA